MSTIPKEQIVYRPTRDETYIAFAAAIDAWSKVEWQMMFLFNSVNTPSDLNKSGSILMSIIGVRAQLRTIEAAARAHLKMHPELMTDVERTTEKIGKKAKIRNAIIHGRWRDTEHHSDAGYEYSEMNRVFSSENVFGPIYKTEKERLTMMGKSVFDKAELEKAVGMFEHLSKTIFDLQVKIVSAFVPRLG